MNDMKQARTSVPEANSHSGKAEKHGAVSNVFSVIVVLVVLRVVRSWNQTGQKHAGEADIGKTLLPLHTFVLWFLVLTTFITVTLRFGQSVLPQISSHVAVASSVTLCIATLGFKIAFTKAEAPELLVGFETSFSRLMEEASLLAQARAVFIGIAAVIFLTTFSKAYHRSISGKKTEGKQLPYEPSENSNICAQGSSGQFITF